MNNLVLINFAAEDYIHSCKTISTSILKGFTAGEIDLHHNLNKEIEQKGQTIYITPGCAIPRHKVKSLGFTTTVKPAKADCIVLPADTYGESKHFSSNRFLPVDGKALYGFVKDIYIETDEIDYWGTHDENRQRALTFIKAYLDMPYTIFGITHSSYAKYFWYRNIVSLTLPDSLRNFVAAHNTINVDTWSARKWSTLDKYSKGKMEFIKPLNKELFLTNKEYYTEDSLLKISNSNKISITRDNYLDWKSFAMSEDEENKSLLMELMTNCDFESSIAFLYALLEKYGYSLRKIKGYDHVGFRSLLAYLDLSKAELRYLSLDTIENKIKHKNLWTNKVAADLWWATDN